MNTDLLRKVRDGEVVTSDVSSRSHYQTDSRRVGARLAQLFRLNR